MVPTDLTQVPSSDPLRLYRYRDGLYAVDLLIAAVVHLRFFSWLGRRPGTADEICRHFEIDPRPADVMLTLFTAIGLIELRSGAFHVTDLAREHLTDGSPWDLTPYYASLGDRPVALDFVRVLKTGKPANWSSTAGAADWHAAMTDESFARTFTAAMDCRGAYLAAAIARHVDLSHAARLLDIGGGSGIYACSLVMHNPYLHAAVFDQVPVTAIAERLIAERGLTTRVSTITGDMWRDAWPSGFDVHLFSNVLHDWGVSEVRALLQSSASALQPGGLIVIHDAFINATKTGPLAVAEYSALLMHATQGKCYSTAEYEKFLRDAGFEVVAFSETAADRGVMVARKAATGAHGS